MKESRYNYFIEKGDRTICYNTLQDAILVFPTNAYRVFTRSLDEFKEHYPNNYRRMVEQKVLIEDDADELAEIRLGNKMEVWHSRHFDLTVLPSMDCNLHCWYCFEDHVADSRMSEAVQQRIVRYVEKRVANGEITSLNLEFFGGEPLLDFDRIAYPLGVSLKKIMDEHGLPFNCSFITNASLIDEEMVDKLAELNPSFQITIDGNERRHDKIRFKKADGEGTYRQIIRNIHLLTERLENTYINVRVNYDEKTLEHIDELLNDLNDLDRRKVGLHFERVWQTSAHVDGNDRLKQVIDLFLAHGFRVSYINWHARRCACKSDRYSSMAVNYDGKVYKCTGRNYTDAQSDGVLTEEGDVEWKPGKLAARLGKATFENPMCLECKMLPVCMGPCSQKMLETAPDQLKRVCTLGHLEMKMNEYIEYVLNNKMVVQAAQKERE